MMMHDDNDDDDISSSLPWCRHSLIDLIALIFGYFPIFNTICMYLSIYRHHLLWAGFLLLLLTNDEDDDDDGEAGGGGGEGGEGRAAAPRTSWKKENILPKGVLPKTILAVCVWMDDDDDDDGSMRHTYWSFFSSFISYI